MSDLSDISNSKLDRPMRTDDLSHGRPPWLSDIVLNDLKRASTCGVVFISAFLAHVTWFSNQSDLNLPQAIAIAAGTLLSTYLPVVSAHQSQHKLVNNPILNTIKNWSIHMFLVFILYYVAFWDSSIPVAWIFVWFLYGLIGILAVHLLFDYQIRRWRRLGVLTTNIVVVSAGEIGYRLVQHITQALDSSDRLIGVFYDYEFHPSCNSDGESTMDARNELLCFARSNRIDRVIVALPWHAEDRLLSWLKLLRVLPADILLCPPVLTTSLESLDIKQNNTIPLLTILRRPLSDWSYITKAIEDRFFALLLLLLTGPAMLLIALVIRLDSPGPALFRQKRYGFNNSPIEVLKFRTMYTDLAESGIGSITQAKRGDRRVTRVGRWLRHTSLDELPQLINVLCGQMSLVGPRPHAIAHNVQYEKTIEVYRARHRVKPGITGWAQVNGLRGETDTDEKMVRRVEYDLYYIDHWSLLFDFSIIARTAFVGFVNRNAY